MKKILLIAIGLLLVVGCSCSNHTAADAVEQYFNDYKGLSEDVLKNLDELIDKEDLTKEQQEVYRNIVKKQYRDLNYTILNEDYNGDTAKVTVKITVYDLYKAQKEANNYLNANAKEFLTDGVYDAKKYLDYKLDLMTKEKETVSYNIVINTIKVDGKYQVEQPNTITLEKIHGVYNYEEDID